MFITYNFYFYKNHVILAEPLSICLSIYLYIIHADYFCQAMDDLKQILYCNTQIRVYHIYLLTEPQAMLQLKLLMV